MGRDYKISPSEFGENFAPSYPAFIRKIEDMIEDVEDLTDDIEKMYRCGDIDIVIRGRAGKIKDREAVEKGLDDIRGYIGGVRSRVWFLGKLLEKSVKEADSEQPKEN